MTKEQQKYLKDRAQQIKPVVMIGKHGLTDGVVQMTDEALTVHELIKVRILDTDTIPVRDAAEQLSERCKAETIHTIGKTMVLFRINPEKTEQPLKACGLMLSRAHLRALGK